MKFFYSFLLLSTLLTATCCSDEHHEPQAAAPELRIAPDIRSRATDTHFENPDAIGVTVRKQDGSNYLANQKFIYDGSTFSANGVQWYPETEGTSTVIAYYPYAETGQPGSFTVKTDQRGTGYTLSDLLGATKSNVEPTFSPVELTFYHLLAKIDITVELPEGATIEKIEINGFIPTVDANIEAQTVAVDANAAATAITAHEITANKTYDIILPPQKAQMQINVKTSAGYSSQSFSNVVLLQGKRYTLQLKISETQDHIEAEFTGQIQDWGSGGVIEQDMDENKTIITEPVDPDQGQEGQGLTYGGVTYPTQIIAGREWMAQNLRYIPENATHPTDYKYPDGKEESAATLGILYTYSTARAGADPVLNDESTVRGICPEGWRLPKINELVDLAKTTGRAFFQESGYIVSNAEGYGYFSDRNYVMSSTKESADRIYYLRVWNIGQKLIETKNLPTGNIFASIRCVKEQ